MPLVEPNCFVLEVRDNSLSSWVYFGTYDTTDQAVEVINNMEGFKGQDFRLYHFPSLVEIMYGSSI